MIVLIYSYFSVNSCRFFFICVFVHLSVSKHQSSWCYQFPSISMLSVLLTFLISCFCLLLFWLLFWDGFFFYFLDILIHLIGSLLGMGFLDIITSCFVDGFFLHILCCKIFQISELFGLVSKLMVCLLESCCFTFRFTNFIVFLNFAFINRQPVCDTSTRSDPPNRDTTRHGLGLKISTRLVKRVVSGLMFLTRQYVTRLIATPNVPIK